MGLLRNIFGTHFKVVSPKKLAEEQAEYIQLEKRKELERTIRQRSDERWVRDHNTEDPEIIRTKYEIKSLSNSISKHISFLKQPMSLLTKKSKAKDIDKINHLNELINDLTSDNYLNDAIISNDFSWIEKYDLAINSIDSIANHNQNKKINKLLDEYHAKDFKLSDYAKRLRVLINNLDQAMQSQKAEVQSSSKADANDPQKAEKLAKIAKLQRELDELKGEVK